MRDQTRWPSPCPMAPLAGASRCWPTRTARDAKKCCWSTWPSRPILDQLVETCCRFRWAKSKKAPPMILRAFLRDKRTVALALVLGLVSPTSADWVSGQDAKPVAARVVASCGFDGPYSQGEQQIHEGCINNWQWGRKDMMLKADRDADRPGTVQRIQVRGITSGGMQFFYTKLKLKKDHFYKISYWLKSDGLEGPVRAYVRKGGHPWTVYVYGDYEPRTSQWAEYSFTGRCTEDVNEDVGVCWETGSIGTIWLDDLKVEESQQPFKTPVKIEPEPSGNFLPRSSFEGPRDHLWCQTFFGWDRNGVWEGVEGDWEDPQTYRAAGGKVGKYCLAVPNAAHAGQPGCHSTLFDLLPGRPYTHVRPTHRPPSFPRQVRPSPGLHLDARQQSVGRWHAALRGLVA